MTSFSDLLQQGAAHAWLFIPSAILLGALHGLEPGHSKTMMAAFIVAIRGSVSQAVLLGLSAALSHTLVVWVIALIGLHYANSFDVETSEPYFQLASAVIVVGVAAWMLWRTWRDQHGGHGHHHHHDHDHDDEVRRIDTGHGVMALEVFEDGVPPRWRLRSEGGQGWRASEVTVETIRPDGARQAFAFADRGGYLESLEEIPEPHAFEAKLRLAHGGHAHEYDFAFQEHEHGHDHDHSHAGLDVSSPGFQDAHERAHAEDIRRRFTNRPVTTWQIILFGLTGGLIPCPAAITVLLLCLQLQQFSLGAALVLCFSVGLAVVMVSVGVAAAIGMRHAERRWSGLFDRVARRAPYVSAALILLVGLYIGWSGWSALPPGTL
ncbi:nickel/cobalt efflux transporter [Roseomonas gilardii]|uniref:nickel/cobalt efflux transporter n=1 Tax=Roseomonas gilardii TaxID=257708 RepID=UPI000489C3AE|nr:nickel/cobalt efflux transporter [Roseomonas gilardii]SUE43994.1 Nickel/cobalt efflux system rcnA [Roseomonas gilardii subsp. rosea]